MSSVSKVSFSARCSRALWSFGKIRWIAVNADQLYTLRRKVEKAEICFFFYRFCIPLSNAKLSLYVMEQIYLGLIFRLVWIQSALVILIFTKKEAIIQREVRTI